MARWQDTIWADNFYDALTEPERQQLREMWDRGVLTEHNLPEVVDRFMRAPDRDTALEQAFKTGFGANVSREWGAIRDAIADPGIGVEAFEEHYREKGPIIGTADIAWSAITTPYRSWKTILSGELGDSENPLETIVGGASIIPVGSAASGVGSRLFHAAAKSAARAGNISKLTSRMARSNQLGRFTQSKFWKPTRRIIEGGDIITGAPEWPLELIGEGTLEFASSLGEGAINRLRNQDNVIDEIVNLAKQIQTKDPVEDKIAIAATLINENVLQRIVDENEDIESLADARDLLTLNAYARYLERTMKEGEDSNEEARTEAEAHDDLTGSNTAPSRPWSEIRRRSEEHAAEADAIVEDMIAQEEAEAQRLQDEKRARQQEESWIRYRDQYRRANAVRWNQFRDRYLPLYDQLADTPEQARDMMLNDFALGNDPVATLEEAIFAEESEGIDLGTESPAVARQRTHERLRNMLGDQLYEEHYGGRQRRSVDDIVKDADRVTDEIMDGKEETDEDAESGTDTSAGTTPTEQTTPEETEEGEQAAAAEETETDETGTEPEQEPTPEDVEGRAAADAEREQLHEVEGQKDVVRWKNADNEWVETPVVYKLIERRAAIASHRFSANRVSLEQNPIYNWALGIQGRKQGRYEEIQERANPEEFNPYLLSERTQGTTRGTPTLLESYDAAGGNHRLMLLELIYSRDGESKAKYLDMLQEVLPDFGIDPEKLQNFEEPVLIRQVVGALDDPAAFADATNQEDAAPRTTEHQAEQDAQALTPEILDSFEFGETGGSNRKTIAEILANPTAQNQNALLAFIDNLVQQARARYRRGDTRNLSAEARFLFENVVFVKTFTSERGKLLFEAKENGTLVPNQNARALLMALPHIAKFDAFLRNYRADVQTLSIADDVAAAFQFLSQLRGEPNNFSIGQVGAHLDTIPMQDDPTITPESRILMKAIYASQSPTYIANIVIGYIGKAMEAIQASGVPVIQQEPLMEGGDVYTGQTKEEILQEVIEEANKPKEKKEDTGQTSLLEDDDAEPTDDGGTSPEPTGTGDTPSSDEGGGPADEQPDADTGTDGTGSGQRRTGTDESGTGGQTDEPERTGDQQPEQDTTDTGGRGRDTTDESVDPDGGDTETTGTDTGGTPQSDTEHSGGRKSTTQRARERLKQQRRAKREGTQDTDTSPTTGSDATPETTPGDTTPAETAETPEQTEPKSTSQRALDRMRRRRGEIRKASVLTPEQQELIDDYIEALREELIEELQAEQPLDGVAQELFVALQTDPDALTAEQALLVDEYIEDLKAETIEELEAEDNLDADDQELLAALHADMPVYPEDEEFEPEPTPEEEAPTTPDIEPETDTEPEQVETVPDSVPIEEQHVSPLHEPTALASQRHPNVDDIALDLSDEAWGVVSAAQVLAVKLMKRSTNNFFAYGENEISMRLGFLLGDGTGSGKTITGLTFILDQIANGNRQHFIIGPKNDLFTNNYKSDMKMLGGPVSKMFNFKDHKRTDRVKKGAGIGFATYKSLTDQYGYVNLHTGQIGTRFSQLLENLAGKRPPLIVLNPEAYGTIQWLKQVGGGAFPTWDQLYNAYQNQKPEDQNALIPNIPKALGSMLNAPNTHTAKKYNDVLKILKDFDNYDTKYKTDSLDDFMEAALKFEGVILFDEAHNMRGDDTTTHKIGHILQRAAPNARVVYLTATPITKVEEIQYAERLGLWGPDMPFKTYEEFERAFAGDDLTAKEVIAKDLKGYGRYLRRNLDMSGVKWETREHKLTDDEKAQYDQYVNVMQEIKQYLRIWVERQTHLETGYGKAQSQLMGDVMKAFYNEQQNFFNQLQTAYKTRALIPEMIQQLKDGKKVAVQLAKTGETAQKRAEERAGEGQEPDLSLKNMLIDFLMRDSSPIYKRQPKSTGRGLIYDTNAQGNRVIVSNNSVQERDSIIRKIQSLPEMPGLAIDMLHSAIREAGFNTAEITGRNEFYVREDGKLKKYKNPKNTDNIEKQFRETRDLNFIIISDAGGEGRNLQTKRQDSPLIDYDIDAGWNIIGTIQKFGRFKRTGAAHDPVYVLTETDSPANKRRTGALALKLTDMGALATGQARSQMNLRDAQRQAEAEGNEDADNYILGPHGKAAMRDLWRHFHANEGDPFIDQLMRDLGFVDSKGNPKFETDSDGKLKPSGIPEPKTYLARLYGARYDKQAEYAELFFNQLDGHLAAATEQGLLDTGTTQLRTRNAKINRRQTLTTHQESGTTTDVVEITGEQTLQRNSWEVIEGIRTKQPGYEAMAGPFSRIVRNTKSGKVYALFITTVEGGEAGQTARGVTRYKRFSPRGKPDYINSTQLASGNWETIFGRDTAEDQRDAKLAEAETLWREAEKQATATKPLSRVMITGMLIPIWDRISIKGTHLGARTAEEFLQMIRAAGFRSLDEVERSMQIRQVMLADGTPVQGRIVPAQFLETLFGRFGIRLEDTPFADLIESDTETAVDMDTVTENITENKAYIILDNGAVVSQIGEDELEIFGYFTDEDISELGLQPVGNIMDRNSFLFPPDTEYSQRYPIQDTKLGRFRLPVDKLADLLNRIPPDTITERGQDTKPLLIEGINRPEQSDPHPDSYGRAKQYASFIRLRQLILPYAEQLSRNGVWQPGHFSDRSANSKGFTYYLEDVDKYIMLQAGTDTLWFAVEGDTYDGVVTMDARGSVNFVENIINGNSQYIGDRSTIDDFVIKNVRIRRVMRELGKDANADFRPSRHLKAVDVSQFSEDEFHVHVGELPDGQPITIVGHQYKWNFSNPQWTVGIRIGTMPENITNLRHYSGWLTYTLTAKTIVHAIDNAVKKLRDNDIYKGLSVRFADSKTAEAHMAMYDNHIKAVEEETEAERQRIADESEDRDAPRISRRGERDTGTVYALDKEAIASLEADKDKIVATINDTDIQRRVLGIFAKIMHHEKVNLVGQTVSSAQEVAILAQAFRNPLIEVFRTLYIRDGKIVAHDGFTLNSSQMTRSDALRIRERMRENKADSFYILHNHPTAIARFSSADITASHGIHAMFGDQYKGQIVVDSGTYAKITYDDTGRFDRQEELILSPADIGWDTSKDPDLHGIRADDPLYKDFTPEAIEKFKAMYPKHDVYDAWRLSDSPRKGPAPDFSNQEDAPKAIAELGKYLQTRKDWFVVVGMGNTGYITLMTEFTGLMELAEAGKLKEFLYENLDTLGADLFHIIATGGQTVKDALIRELGNSQNPTGLAAGVASIWVDGDSLGTIRPVPTSPQIPSPDIKEGRETEYVTQPPVDDSTPEPEDETETDDDTEQPPTNTDTTENITEAILDAVNSGAFSDDGDIMEVDVDGVGLVEISIEDDILVITSDAGQDMDIEIPESIHESFINDDISMEELVSLTLAAEAQQSSEQTSDTDFEPEDDPNAEDAERQAREDMGDEGIIEFEKASADPADAPDPADESAVIHIMPNPDDFDRETRDNTGVQRALNKFTDAASGIRQILGLASRQGARITRKTISSGFGILEEMSKTDREGADKIGDHIRKNILRRQFIYKSQFARDAARLLPILKEFDTYVNKKATPTLTSKVTPQQVARRKDVRERVNDVVWRYIEDNREIKDPELLEIAKKMKEAWREMLIEGTRTMLELTEELNETLNETIFITDSDGNKVPWYPEEFDGFIWDADAKKFKRNEGTAKNPKWVHYTIEEAHRQAKRLYTPHYFYHNKLRQQHRLLKKLIEDMNTLIKSDNPAADPNKLLSIGIKHDSAADSFIFLPDGRFFDNVLEALEHAVEYWTERELSMRGLLEYTDAGLRAERYGQQAPGGAMDEPRIGAYGHLERARETDDKFYKRDLRLLLETRRLMWDRVGEFATVGQIHPIIGSSPRLELILEQVRAYRKNKREHALGAVAVALRAGQPDSMFERLPQFGISVEHGLQVQQDWKVYVEDAKGRRVRTDEDIELNIADMNLTDDVLETLREIGFITKNAAGADVIAGETIEDRHLTVARFFYEFYNTVAQREASVKDLYLSLGHWHAKDPLLADEAKFWKMISDVTTATTLSWTTALQNLLEIPLITELTGTRTMIQGLTKLFAQESRDQLLDLAQGLSHAPRFMAETDLAEKYLGSYWSGFSITDRLSRAAGLGVGLVNAKRKIKQYKETISEKQKAALRREFEEMALDVKVIEQIPARGLDKLLDDAQELILSGQVTPKFGDSATLSDKLAWTVLQHMHYISDATFKAYDATSLPPFLMKQTPLIRLFMKYKSWMFQHNSFKWKNWRRAVREAKAGNFVPLWNIAQSAAWSGATYGMLLAIYAAAAGDDEPVDMIKGLHAAQTLGMSSVLLEMAARSDGNWWHLSRDMMGQAAGPVGSITSQTVAPMITGDWNVAGSQVQRRIPVVNVFRRMGGFRLLEETFDAEE